MKKIFTLCVVLCMSYLSMGATNLKHEFRATWLTTAWGNDWPKTKVTNATTRKQQQDELIAIFDRLQAGNMNAVCMQVRGRSDAFYQSSYEPWAAELAGARGKDPGYDPLAFAIEEAHKRGLELHAWVNPFRVTSTGTLDAKDLVKKNAGQWIIKYNNGTFTGEIIDPGYPEAREYVLNVLMEIISNYDIDGIVMDDYFYPYGGTTTEDAASKALHKPANVVDVNKDGKTDDDWRRSNVDVFLKELYDRIQAKKPWVRFGMGTFGIWTTQTKVAQAYGISLPSGISGLDDYDVQACNPVEWVKNGYVDYINPQLYWPTTSTGQNYNKLCHWWAKDVCEHFSNQLTNGKKVHFFSSQSISSNRSLTEIQAQVDANRSNLSSGYTGSVFFDTDAYLTMDKDLMTSRFATNALTPPMDWKSNTALVAPTNLTVSGSTLTWQHATAERFTVYVYPKGTAWSTAKNDPAYLQGVIYGNSMDISGIDTNMNDIAVCAYDRFGVEHTAAVYSNDSGAGTTPNPETIIWELNGGEVNTVTVEVPSLTTLEAQFKNDYNSYFGASVATTREITNFLYYGSTVEGGSNLVYNMMNDPAADWTWLRDYIISKSASNTTIQTALLAGTDAHWRYSIVAFLTASAGTNSTYTVDFSTAGQPSKWGTAYQIAHGAVLLPTYVTSAFTLPIPTHPEGHDFLGWYDNAEFIGSPLTTISADWTGSLYAKWHIIDLTWQITYTSTNGNIVTPNATDVFGANIVSYTYQDGQGVITFDGPVTSIGNSAFSSCSSLTSITIPNSVTSIGNHAFNSCSSLTSITIPEGVTSIGYHAFYNCAFTKDNFINNSTLDAEKENYWGARVGDTEIDGLLIKDDTILVACRPHLTSVTIPNSVTSIGEDAFYWCSSLTSVTINSDAIVNNKNYSSASNFSRIFGSQVTEYIIGDEVTSIGSSAFRGCYSLTSVTIPNSVTSIGEDAFYWCSSLTSVTIPNSVTSIGSSAFYKCSGLTKTNYMGDVAGWCDIKFGDSSANPISESHNFYINDVEIKDLVIPNNVDTINNYAFFSCKSLTSITIPNSVTSIGEDAFAYCSSLTSITIPNSVTSIGEGAFNYCSSLTSVTIPNSVTSIGGYAFHGCSKLTSITIPNSVTSIGEYLFDGCSSLTSVTIPNSVTSIGGYAFRGCSSLTSVTINSNAIVKKVYSYYSNISHIFGSQVTEYIIGDEVKSIGEYAFYECSALTSVTIPNSVTSIGGYAFRGCSKLTSITIPNSVTSIGEDAFYDCSSLTSVTIPESVTSIGEDAFYWCSSLTSVTISNSVTSIGSLAFFGCSSLTSVTLTAHSIEEFLQGKGNNLLDDVSCERKIQINNQEVTEFTIPNGVTSIGKRAFYNCSSLTSISIPNSVTSIGSKAFSGCTSLKSITIPNSVTSLPTNVFANCTALNEITLPASVKSIGENAFAGCTKLYDIYCFAMEPPTAYESSFANYNAFLHVPCDNQRVYLLDVIFGEFKYIECIGAETTTTDTVVVDPSFNDAEFIWPSNSSADSYTLAISKDGEVFCTLTFNANGQLTGIAFAPSRNGQHNAPAAAQTANGFAFTVTGLDEGANYTYELLIQDRSGNTLQSYSGEFRTQSTNDRTVIVEYDAQQGIVTGAGTYLVGDTVILTATPNDGYRFVQWSDGNTDNPRTLVLTQDTILTAEFALTISGQCGDNLYWAYDEASKTIAITGSGDMYDYTKDTQPWLLFQDQITEVTTSNTTTSIGDWAFDDCSGLTSVTIGNSVTSIGEQAFNGCSSLTSITIPNSVTSIGEGAFEYCSSLDTIHVEATTPPALEDSTVFMNTPSPVCVIPCGTLATYQSSDWANQVGSFVEDCPPASAAITYVLNGGVQSEWETPQTMYNELNAVWNAFSGTSKTWGNLEDLKANVANGIPTQAGTMALDFIADENFKAKFEWLVTYMDAKCTEQGQTLPSSNASFLRYNLQAFFIDGMRTSWPISADYTICGVSTVEAYQPYWKSGFANPTNPTEEFVLNAPYREGYTFAGWYTTPDFSGKKVTIVNSETTGTLYAKWVEYIPTIAEVWNMEEGVETKISGVVNWVRYGNVFIQDITGGFRVYIPNDSTRLIPEVGTKIIAKGVRGSFAGSPQLNDAVIESSEPATLADPVVTTLEDLCANPLKYFGQRVFVEVVYVAEYDTYGNIYVAERDGSNKVKGHYMVVDPIAFPVGTKVSITAVASQYDGAFQFEGDIAGIELAPGPKRDTYEYPIRNEKYTLTNDWVISNIEGNFAANKLAPTDSWFVRGMAAKDGIMYFINRETQSLIRVDGATGHMLDPIKITGEHLFEVYDEEMGEWKSDVIYGYNDIKFDQAGNCLIGACTTGGATRCQTFFIYIVDLETGVCTKLIEDVLWDNPSLDQVQFRFDAFGVAGDVTKNGVVMAADAQSWNVYRWLIKNGVVGDGEQINCALNAEIDESLFIETENFGTAPQIFPQDELGELFYVDGASTLPMLFDGDGMLLDDFINVPTGRNVWNSNGDTISINSGHLNGLIEFQVGEEYFLLMAATYSTHNVPSTFALYKFADENRAFSGMEPLWYFPHNGMGSNTNGYRTAVPSVDIIDNNTAKLYLYVGENGYACYTLNVGDNTAEPIDPTWQITYTSSNDSIVTPYATDVFGANIVSNTYENGVGTITFDGPVTSIGRCAFNKCSSLSSIVIPNTVEKIGVCAFYGSSIISLDIPNSVTSLGDWAFADTPIESIAIPNSVTHIGVALLTACNSLTSIVVEEGNSNYDSRDNCNAIIEKSTNRLIATCPNTIIPNTVTTIATRAFQNSAITSIDIPNSVVRIEAYAFRWATQLNSITIPSSVGYIGDSVFYSCPLDTIRMEAMTPPTIGVNPLSSLPVYVIPCGTLAAYKSSAWASQVGEFVEEGCAPVQQCGDNLFWEYADGVLTIIGSGDMYDYADDKTGPAPWYDVRGSIKAINMPDEMTKIGDYAFYRCTNLTTINMPASLIAIGEKAFAQDSKLIGALTLPATLAEIGERAFYNCIGVDRYTIQAMTPPVLGDDVFKYANANTGFYVSCEALDAYKAAVGWSSLNLRDACLNIYHYGTPSGANGVHTTEDTLVANIYYRRHFTPNRWETLYLPFEVDRVTVLEEGVEYDLKAWNIFGGGHYYLAKPYGIENKEVVFGFTQVVDAHIPYIIQFKDEYYRDKIITFYSEESWNKLSTSFEMLSSSFEMQMAGNTTLQDQTLEKPVYMLRATSNFILQNTTTTLHPFECYVMPYATPSGTPARMNVRFRGDVPTAVESVKGNESHLTYTVDGYTLTVYPQGQAFSIYSLNGALIYSCEAGKEAVDCELNSGCYLLHAGTEAHKIML